MRGAAGRVASESNGLIIALMRKMVILDIGIHHHNSPVSLPVPLCHV